MSIFESLKDYPCTIPFLGRVASIELDLEARTDKDLVIKMTFPLGVSDIDEVADKAIKFFDGELIHKENMLIIFKADIKMLGYVLMFEFKNRYLEIK